MRVGLASCADRAAHSEHCVLHWNYLCVNKQICAYSTGSLGNHLGPCPGSSSQSCTPVYRRGRTSAGTSGQEAGSSWVTDWVTNRFPSDQSAYHGLCSFIKPGYRVKKGEIPSRIHSLLFRSTSGFVNNAPSQTLISVCSLLLSIFKRKGKLAP